MIWTLVGHCRKSIYVNKIWWLCLPDQCHHSNSLTFDKNLLGVGRSALPYLQNLTAQWLELACRWKIGTECPRCEHAPRTQHLEGAADARSLRRRLVAVQDRRYETCHPSPIMANLFLFSPYGHGHPYWFVGREIERCWGRFRGRGWDRPNIGKPNC